MFQLMFVVALCAPMQAKAGDAKVSEVKLSDDDKFLLERAEKALLDPKSSDKRFNEARETCSRFGRLGVALLTKATTVYEKSKDKECVQRHAQCVHAVVGICRESPVLFPDSFLPQLVAMLEKYKASNNTDFIRMCGRLGGRAEKALPVLREIRDGENVGTALEALQAIRFIEADLKKKG